jgi:PAS domain-containing protein
MAQLKAPARPCGCRRPAARVADRRHDGDGNPASTATSASAKRKCRRLIDANIVGFFICGVDGRIHDANDAFLSMVGYEQEDLAAVRLR